jgi:TctA family transporter
MEQSITNNKQLSSMKTMKNIWKLTVVILFCTLGLSNAQAQDKYGFLDITLVDGYGVCNEETNYYAISDPIKNWDKLSSEQKEKLQTKFVAEVNQQIGCKRAANSSFTFSRSSLTETREEIMETINNKKSHYGGSDRKPLKIVRINLHEY